MGKDRRNHDNVTACLCPCDRMKLSWLTGRPLVVDYRDLWTQNEGYHSESSPHVLRKDRWMERSVEAGKSCRDLDRGIQRTRPKEQPDNRPGKYLTITNGIDPDDFRDIDFPKQRTNEIHNAPSWQPIRQRNPEFFFRALKAWLARRPEAVGRDLRFFYGNTPGYESMAKGRPLERSGGIQRTCPSTGDPADALEGGHAPARSRVSSGRGRCDAGQTVRIRMYWAADLAFVPEGVAAR